MGINYLKLKESKSKSIDCLLTSNIDENYIEAYPEIQRENVFEECSCYPSDDYVEIENKIKKHFGIKTGLILGNGSEELIIRLNDFFEQKNLKLLL